MAVDGERRAQELLIVFSLISFVFFGM